MNSNRPSWDEYFLDITHKVKERSKCLRRQVGAILVKDKRIIATGYNGVPSKIRHCDEVGGCIRDINNIESGKNHEICRGLHAEQNAIIQAALYGVSTEGSTLYCTHKPCIICTKMLINAKIKRIVCSDDYPDKLSLGMLKEAKIDVTILSNEENK